jgi:3-deoxy-manno-octulosonate cytidylyltransferase (CMP-KDO synthetase)
LGRFQLKSIGLIIPARAASSRFPNKPLALIGGKKMIQRVWENAARDFNPSNIWIATDDSIIFSEAQAFGANAIMTSDQCLTGTDRIAEANKTLNFDYVMNVQGDEPILEPWILEKVLKVTQEEDFDALNCMAPILQYADFMSLDIPKVVTNSNDELLYMSRAPIPQGKEENNLLQRVFRQVCVYVFSQKALSFYGKDKKKSSLETIEDIEILRLLEHSCPVKMIEVQSSSVAVDKPEDIKRVEKILDSNAALLL